MAKQQKFRPKYKGPSSDHVKTLEEKMAILMNHCYPVGPLFEDIGVEVSEGIVSTGRGIILDVTERLKASIPHYRFQSRGLDNTERNIEVYTISNLFEITIDTTCYQIRHKDVP